MRHLAEEQLVAFRLGYAEPDEASTIEAHLGTCESCRAGLDAIDATLSAVARVPVPERSDGYGAEVWAHIQPRLEPPAPWWRGVLRSLFQPRSLALAGGVAVLVFAAFVAGRFYPRPDSRIASNPPAGQAAGKGESAQAGAAGAASDVRQDVLLVAVGDHLERSQIALAELVNSANTPVVDISTEQERARDLVTENRLYRQTALDTGDSTLAAALDDLGRVLVEVANGPSELPRAEFERVRQRIEAQGTIFKVRVLGERVREQQARPTTDGRAKG